MACLAARLQRAENENLSHTQKNEIRELIEELEAERQ
jgi:hypothetical protein